MKITLLGFLSPSLHASLVALACAFSWGSLASAEVTPTTIYDFPHDGSSGEEPSAPLIQATDGNFYGTTFTGGAGSSNGTIFKLTPAGSLTTIVRFGDNSQVQNPASALTQGTDGKLYGVSVNGGAANHGAIYRTTTDGVFEILHNFLSSESIPLNQPLLAASDGNFYGPGRQGGTNTIYKLTPDGDVSTFFSFPADVGGSNELIQARDGNFYGTTHHGSNDLGTVFRLTPAGVLTILHTFTGPTNGSTPNSGLVQGSDRNFYGTTTGGTASDRGMIFKVTSDGVFTSLYSFTGGNDGDDPSKLVQASDGNFYGTTPFNDFSSPFYGTIFKVTPAGVLTTLYHFPADGGMSGAAPVAGLIQGSDGGLYGTTTGGGTGGMGTIFRVDAGLPPPLAAAFTVNESSSPTAAAPDSVLRFRAIQNQQAAGLLVHVQSSTAPAPAPESSWTDLPDGLGGRMVYAPQVTSYILNSTNYPASNGISFRAVTRAPGYPPGMSNVVGPFNLASNTPRLGPTLLFVTTNGEINSIRFGVNEATVPAGASVTVQTTQTPAVESSWANAPIGNGGLMTQDPSDTKQFYLGTDNYPESEGNYFRAVATSAGSVPSYSIPYGPFKFVNDPASTVLIQVNGVPVAPNDIDNPSLLPSGTFNFSATASSGRFLKRLTLLYDGNIVAHFDEGATSGALDYTTNIPGDHLVEAYATDDLGVTGVAAPIHVRILAAAPGKTYQMTTSGDWNDAANWIDSQGNHAVPGPNDFAIVSTFSPTLSSDVTVNAISLNGGTLEGTKTLTVTGFCTIADGAIKANLTIPAGATAECLNDSDITLTGKLTYAGTMRLHGKGGIGGMHTGANRSTLSGAQPDSGIGDFLGGIINGVGRFISDLASGGRRGSKATPAPPAAIAPEVRTIAAATINISGGSVTTIPAPAKLISQDGGGLISQDGGGLISQDGGGLVASGAGNLVASGAGNLVASGAGNLISQDGGGLLATGGSMLVASGAGNLVASGAGNLVASGAGNRPAGVSSATEAVSTAGISVDGGELNLSGFTIYGNATLNGGVLTGSGIILGDLTNSSGYISPGHSAGAIAVTGAFAQEASGTLIVEDGGATPDKFDQLLVAGPVTLDGKLDVKLTNHYNPDAADTFNPVSYGTLSGSFASVSANAQVTATDGGLLLTINPAVASPPFGQPLNISTRLRVLTDDNVLIGGFIVTGAPGSSKAVLLRGKGPSLADGGLTGVLADPLLELHKADGSVVTNDNWQTAPNQERIPAGFAPTNPKESLIIADLAPGNYTVIEKGAHGETGIGLTEVYDIDGNKTVALGNISTRGLADTGDNVMIAGFIVGGSEPASILVRATGPSLARPPANLSGVLEDPVLELHDSNGGVITNDDWRETQEAEIIASTVAPADDKEPAILATLVPGNYTAIVRGKDDATGIAVVEVYRVK